MLINAFRRWGYPEEYAHENTPHRWHPDYFALNREGSGVTIVCQAMHELFQGVYTCQDGHFVSVESRDDPRARRIGFHVQLSHTQDHEMTFQVPLTVLKAWGHGRAVQFRTADGRQQFAQMILEHKKNHNSWVLFARMLGLENPEETT